LLIFSEISGNIKSLERSQPDVLVCVCIWSKFSLFNKLLESMHLFLSHYTRDVIETLAYETEMRLRQLVFGPRRDRDQDLPAIPRDRDVWFLPQEETETLQGQDRDVFRDLQPSALCQNNEWEPASLDVTNRSVTATATAVFIIMKFIHHISIKT